jgi:hypothetical protein
MQVRRETLKPPHRLWIAIRSHSDVMHAIAYIDPCCLRMDYLQARVIRLQPPHPFLSLLVISPQFLVCHHSRTSLKIGIRFGPVTIG